MKNMKMKTKMIIGFAIPIILTIINVLVGITSVKRIENAIVDMQTKQFSTITKTMEEIGADEAKAKVVTDTLKESMVHDNELITRTANISNLVSVGMIVVSIVITLIIAYSLIKTINKSVAQLSRAAGEIAMGRVDVEMVKYNNDEFGELVDEYKQVIDNIKYQASIAEEVSKGNLTITVNPKCAEDLMGQSLKKLVEDNNHVLSSISDAAYQVSIGSSQMASASQSLAQGSTEQASAIEEITASMDEIVEATAQNAEQANKAAALVETAIKDVKQGNVRMQDMMAAMQDINKSSESISKIIKVIDDIAFQTNILALNAAVEAARAGEAGKGFAVVAEEVRSLAAKSAAAASETAGLIEDSIQKVGQGSQMADETAKALDMITDVVNQSEVLIHSIAQACNYQATSGAQIKQAITQVSQVVQTNSATSEQCASASEELSNQADRMREKLSIYRLSNAAVASSSNSSIGSFTASPSANEQIISLGGDSFGKY
ncbi:MAG: methyl-accepting chemotaxis protein [bacterium]|nr:methyl-accepting chemotaxis protein [bacterium]MCM1373919.1 methyl-accepting chemotaxis protein [Muribaculum sp.]